MPTRRERTKHFKSAEELYEAVVSWAHTKCTYPSPLQIWTHSHAVFPRRARAEAGGQLAVLREALLRFVAAEADSELHVVDRTLVDAVNRLEQSVAQEQTRMSVKARREQGRLVMLVDALSPPPKVDPVDYYAAAAVLAEPPSGWRGKAGRLVGPADFRSILQQAGRGRRAPTLIDGVEVVRKRVREALAFWE